MIEDPLSSLKCLQSFFFILKVNTLTEEGQFFWKCGEKKGFPLVSNYAPQLVCFPVSSVCCRCVSAHTHVCVLCGWGFGKLSKEHPQWACCTFSPGRKSAGHCREAASGSDVCGAGSGFPAQF